MTMNAPIQTFDVEPPAAPTMLLFGALALLPVVAVGLVLLAPSSRGNPALAIVAAFFASAIVGTFGVASVRRRSIEITAMQLVVKAGLFTRRVALSDLDVAGARVADAGERAETRTVLKMFGASLPGYRAGWFVMRDGHRAFVLATTARALLLPVHGAAPYVLTPRNPEALLAALRGMTPAPPPR